MLDHRRAHVFFPVDDFFMPAVNHWPRLGVPQVAAGPLDHVTGCRVGVATLGTLEAPGSRLEFALKAALEALVN